MQLLHPPARRECSGEVHGAAAAALEGVAAQPGGAAELADCAAFYMLRRLLLREELPAEVRAHGQRVVAAVRQALLADSGARGRWGASALFMCLLGLRTRPARCCSLRLGGTSCSDAAPGWPPAPHTCRRLGRRAGRAAGGRGGRRDRGC